MQLLVPLLAVVGCQLPVIRVTCKQFALVNTTLTGGNIFEMFETGLAVDKCLVAAATGDAKLRIGMSKKPPVACCQWFRHLAFLECADLRATRSCQRLFGS